jgi:N-acetylglutamate synthase-like GNAT family acetyltransferase
VNYNYHPMKKNDFEVEVYNKNTHKSEPIILWKKSLLDLIPRINITFFLKKTIFYFLAFSLTLGFFNFLLFYLSVVPYLLFLLYLTQRTKNGLKNSVNSQEDMESPESISQRYFTNEKNHFWVIFQEKCFGCIAVHEKSKFVAKINRMSVDVNTRGKGLATKLYNKLEQFCREKEYKSIYLSTTEIQHEAIELYKKLGFVQIGSTNVEWFFSVLEFEKKL